MLITSEGPESQASRQRLLGHDAYPMAFPPTAFLGEFQGDLRLSPRNLFPRQAAVYKGTLVKSSLNSKVIRKCVEDSPSNEKAGMWAHLPSATHFPAPDLCLPICPSRQIHVDKESSGW